MVIEWVDGAGAGGFVHSGARARAWFGLWWAVIKGSARPRERSTMRISLICNHARRITFVLFTTV